MSLPTSAGTPGPQADAADAGAVAAASSATSVSRPSLALSLHDEASPLCEYPIASPSAVHAHALAASPNQLIPRKQASLFSLSRCSAQ